MAKASHSSNPTVVDAASLFAACEVLAERIGRPKITIDYSKLGDRLELCRTSAGWRRASTSTILLSIDPGSEGQQRFQTMLHASGFDVDTVFFRDAFVSVPPGRTPTDLSGKSVISLAPRIAYIAGLMARFPDPQLLVVSHSFELFAPLTDLKRRIPTGKVGIAYFASLMDYRWRATGLTERKLEVEFFDLDHYGKDLIGIDLLDRADAESGPQVGLSRF